MTPQPLHHEPHDTPDTPDTLHHLDILQFLRDLRAVMLDLAHPDRRGFAMPHC